METGALDMLQDMEAVLWSTWMLGNTTAEAATVGIGGKRELCFSLGCRPVLKYGEYSTSCSQESSVGLTVRFGHEMGLGSIHGPG